MMLSILLTMGLIGWGVFSLFDDSDSSDESDNSNDSNDSSDGAPIHDEPPIQVDVEEGTTGNDFLDGGNQADIMDGRKGYDLIQGNGGDDVIGGGKGYDTLHGGAGKDVMVGNDGHDELAGGSGDDVMSGGAGQDVLYGNQGDDNLFGGFGNQQADGSGTDSTIDFAVATTELVFNDPELAQNGSNEEILASKYFDDVDVDGLHKGTGADGSDTLFGGDGDDRLNLRATDVGTGGDGADTFVLSSGENSAAVIKDFDITQDGIEVAYDASMGEVDLEVVADGDDAVIMSGETEIGRLVGQGAQADEISISLIPAPNLSLLS